MLNSFFWKVFRCISRHPEYTAKLYQAVCPRPKRLKMRVIKSLIRKGDGFLSLGNSGDEYVLPKLVPQTQCNSHPLGIRRGCTQRLAVWTVDRLQQCVQLIQVKQTPSRRACWEEEKINVVIYLVNCNTCFICSRIHVYTMCIHTHYSNT